MRRFLLAFLVLAATASAETPEMGVRSLYDWYLSDPLSSRERLGAIQDRFEPELFRLLKTGFSRQPGDGFWVDFDPFVNAQVEARKVSVGKTQRDVNIAIVNAVPVFDFGEGPPIRVYLVQWGQRWLITNLAYDGFNLRDYLKEGLE